MRKHTFATVNTDTGKVTLLSCRKSRALRAWKRLGASGRQNLRLVIVKRDTGIIVADADVNQGGNGDA